MTHVTVDVPEQALFRLTDMAEAYGMTLPEYLLAAGVESARRIETREEQVRHLHALGLTDREMAARIGTTANAVGSTRRLLHLPPNPGPTPAQIGHAA